MPILPNIQAQLKNTRGARNDARILLQKNQEAIQKLEEQIREQERNLSPNDNTNEQRTLLLKLQESSEGLLKDYITAKSGVVSLHNKFLFDPRPQDLIEELDDEIPFLLFPVRIETRFISVPLGTELWVRIFPDDIAITTHEKTLTENEVTYGTQYWKDRWLAKNDESLQMGAWNVLANAFGSNRASWVAKQTKPTNFSDTSVTTVNNLLFPVQDLSRSYAWSEAPHTRIMPDRFVVTGYSNNKIIFEEKGKLIPDPLIMGPDPKQVDTQITRDTITNEIQVKGDMEWVTDFDKAIDLGMGLKITVPSPFDVAGIEKLVVLGLRLSSDATENKVLLEDLIENHRFSDKGFSFLRTGTPTNNTSGNGSGLGGTDTGNENSFALEKKEDPVIITDNELLKMDGQRFAEALDLRMDLVQQIPLADKKDIHEAIAMNIALWPATMGFFLENMMNPVDQDEKPYLDSEAIRLTQEYFGRYVSARGHLPVFRVGAQPYGLLVTSDLSKWVWKEREHIRDNRHQHRLLLQNTFNKLQLTWEKILPQISFVGKAGDGFKHLLNVMGLQASAVEFYNRQGVDEEYEWNWLNFKGAGAYMNQWWQIQLNNKLNLGSQFGFDFTRLPKILDISFLEKHSMLTGPVVDYVADLKSEKLSEDIAIKAYDTDQTHNYIYWLLNSSYNDIVNQVFKSGTEPVAVPKALLYILLRHAYLQTHTDTVLDVMISLELLEIGTKQTKTFLYMNEQSEPSKVEYANVKASAVIDQLPTIYSNFTIADYLRTPAARSIPEVQSLLNQMGALTSLQSLPTARLERMFTEHLDLCTYRLDAWQSGFIQERLQQLRGTISSNGSPNREKRGIYIGAFTWVENLKPDLVNRRIVQKETLPKKIQEAVAGNIAEYLDNGGFIHGFSLNHAVSAAVMRNAYLSHAEPGSKKRMSVNLTSERVRLALNFLDGVRNSQDIPALLGYQFERGLHDRNATMNLDQYIYAVRQKFPLNSKQLTTIADNVPIETIEARNVVDGEQLLKAYQTSGYPYGITGLPSNESSNEAKAIKAELERMANVMDAVGDLALSESVYQLVQGNYDRAGAMMQAFTEGNNPPDPEIVKTPRSGNVITCRSALHLEVDPVDLIWGLSSDSPASATEKGTNKWLANIIGDPANIKCTASWVRNAATNDIQRGDISAADLLLHPIDLVLLNTSDTGNGSSPLEKRIAYIFRQNNNVPDNKQVTIVLRERNVLWGAEVKTFFEIQPLLLSLKELISDCRSLSATDYLMASEGHKGNPSNKRGFDADELKRRVLAAHTKLKTSLSNLSTKKANVVSPFTPIMFEDYRKAFLDLAAFSIEEAFPVSATGMTEAEKTQLDAQAGMLVPLLTSRTDQANKKITFVNTDPLPTDPDERVREQSKRIEQRVALYQEAAKLVFSKTFNVLPRFSVSNSAELATVTANASNLIRYSVNNQDNPLVVEEWVQSTARVRKKMNTLEKVLTFNDTYNPTPLLLTPLQLPHDPNNNWVAVEFPDTMVIKRDYISIMVQSPATPAFGGALCGLLIDEWNEVIPNREETTGIAFHFNQPNAMPPQTLLLAVAPEINGKWTWNELMGTLHDTLHRAKLRTVEPDQLDQTIYAQLLPTVLTPFTSHPHIVSSNFLSNVNVAIQRS